MAGAVAGGEGSDYCTRCRVYERGVTLQEIFSTFRNKKNATMILIHHSFKQSFFSQMFVMLFY
jgi:hypothetical protein